MSGTTKPQTIVSLAAVTWDFPLVGRTRMLTEAWRRTGQETVFVQVPSYRSAMQRVRRDGRSEAFVVRPWPTYPSRLWPVLGEKLLRNAIRSRARGLRGQLERLADLESATALVVSPVWTPWLGELPFERVIYDCIDDLSVQTPRAELSEIYRRWEDELIDRADAAVVSAEVLRGAIRARRGDLPIATIRNGVDAERFEEAAARDARPTDLPEAGRGIVGFVGALYEWIDWDLISAAARAMPETDFVFVGPHDGRGRVAEASELENVRFLGPRPYEQVPAYVAAFHVCWVPFAAGRVSAAANPVKIYEYLALGKPVVSTPVADTEMFEGHVAVGRDAREIVEHLRGALSSAESGEAARRDFARRNTWESRAAEYRDFAASLEGSRRRVAV